MVLLVFGFKLFFFLIFLQFITAVKNIPLTTVYRVNKNSIFRSSCYFLDKLFVFHLRCDITIILKP